MTNNRNTNARRMTRLLLVAGLSLVAVATTAAALPLSLSQGASTPVGSAYADYDDYAASTCISPATPSLPALPAVPAVPLPVPVGLPMPSVGQVSGAATVCADASPDGIHASASADAASLHAETGADADTSAQHDAAKGAAGAVKGFFQDLADKIGSWF